MKKFQFLMRFIAITNFVIWFALGILSLFCMPISGDYGGCTDTFDAPTVKEMQQVVPDTVQPAVVLYKPLVWLIEPRTDEQSLLFALTAFIGLCVAILLLIRALYGSQTLIWRNGVLCAADMLLNVYLAGYVLIVLYGIISVFISSGIMTV